MRVVYALHGHHPSFNPSFRRELNLATMLDNDAKLTRYSFFPLGPTHCCQPLGRMPMALLHRLLATGN